MDRRIQILHLCRILYCRQFLCIFMLWQTCLLLRRNGFLKTRFVVNYLPMDLKSPRFTGVIFYFPELSYALWVLIWPIMNHLILLVCIDF